MSVPLTEAKARFAEIIRRAEAGEEIVLTRHGKPVAVVKAPVVEAKPKLPKIGWLKGQGWIADDFDTCVPPGWEEYFGK